MKLLNRKNEARSSKKNINEGSFVVKQRYLLGYLCDWWKDFQENLVLEQKIFNDSYIFFSVLQNRRNSLRVENGTIHSHKYLVLNRSLWILSSLKAALFARQDLQMTMGKSIISTLAEEPNALEIIQVVVIRECYIENFRFRFAVPPREYAVSTKITSVTSCTCSVFCWPIQCSTFFESIICQKFTFALVGKRIFFDVVQVFGFWWPLSVHHRALSQS